MFSARHLLVATLSALVLATPADARVPRIIAGDGAAIEALPYMASLTVTGRSAREGHFCGGTVIAPAIVLTAAHCVERSRAAAVTVVTGRTRLSDEASGERSRVASIAVHPAWDGTNADVAVLRLAAPVAAAPLALSEGGDHEQPATQAVVAGWGVTGRGGISDELRAVDLPITRTRDCRKTFGGAFDPSTMVCAGGDGHDSCSGDSGGPLLATDGSGTIVQVGIVSFGTDPCGQRGVSGVYTRVSAMRSWLASVTDTQVAPEDPAATARVRIGRISCGRFRCRVELHVSGQVAAVRVGVRDRVARARPAGGGRWVASLALPYGNSTVTASPLRADGSAAGRTARVPIRIT